MPRCPVPPLRSNQPDPSSRLLNPLRRQPAYSFGESGQKQVELVSLFASVRGFDGGEHRRLERIKSVADGGSAGSALDQKLAYFKG